MENNIIKLEKQKNKLYKRKIFIIPLGFLFLFFIITGTAYATVYFQSNRAGGVKNIVNNPISDNDNRTAFTNESDDEVFFIDDKGNAVGEGFANFTIGYFQYLGSVTNTIRGYFSDVDVSGTVNTTNVNATEIYIANQPISGLIDNASYLSTYNATYAGLITNASYGDIYVNETGDTMTGNLEMGEGANITSDVTGSHFGYDSEGAYLII